MKKKIVLSVKSAEKLKIMKHHVLYKTLVTSIICSMCDSKHKIIFKEDL